MNIIRQGHATQICAVGEVTQKKRVTGKGEGIFQYLLKILPRSGL